MRAYIKSELHPQHRTIISHRPEAFDLLRDIIKSYHPRLMIELGYFFFGFTLLMHEAMPNIPFYTFDKKSPKGMMGRAKKRITSTEVDNITKHCLNRNVIIIETNLLKEGGDTFVKSLCEAPDRKFLYCDNGKKIFEVATYGSLLREGDLLGIHDWGHEISYKDKPVKKVLDSFIEHPMNERLEEVGGLSRFFIKVI